MNSILLPIKYIKLEILFFKKLAHAYFRRLYFSKFFGGKIKKIKQNLLTASTEKKF